MNPANIETIMNTAEFNKKTRYCPTCYIEISKNRYDRHLSSIVHNKNIKNKKIYLSEPNQHQYKCPCTPSRLLNMKYKKIHCKSNRHKVYEKYV